MVLPQQIPQNTHNFQHIGGGGGGEGIVESQRDTAAKNEQKNVFLHADA